MIVIRNSCKANTTAAGTAEAFPTIARSDGALKHATIYLAHGSAAKRVIIGVYDDRAGIPARSSAKVSLLLGQQVGTTSRSRGSPSTAGGRTGSRCSRRAAPEPSVT